MEYRVFYISIKNSTALRMFVKIEEHDACNKLWKTVLGVARENFLIRGTISYLKYSCSLTVFTLKDITTRQAAKSTHC